METRRIGALEASVVGLGCNNFGNRIDEPASAAVIHAAVDAGITLFDTADMYAQGLSEEFIGRALGGRRERVVLASKFGKQMGEASERRYGAHPAYIRRAVEDSLRRLRTDRIDLYQQHAFDAEVPIAETLGALDALVRAGQVREIGCSNFTPEQLEAADTAARAGGLARFVSVQNEYSLLEREPERGMLTTCERLGVAFIPYYPLAAGLLSGKYHRGAPLPPGSRLGKRATGIGERADDKLRRVEQLRGYAASRGKDLLDLAFSWLLAKPQVASVIAGATTPVQIAANVRAASWRMGADEVRAADEAAT